MYVCDVSGLRFMYMVHLVMAKKWHAVSWLLTQTNVKLRSYAIGVGGG